MKFWMNGAFQQPPSNSANTISLIGHDGYEARAVAISHDTRDDTFCIWEYCDGYFGRGLTREETLAAMREAIEWIEAQPKGDATHD